MKIVNWILALLFVVFAILQLNDPDPFKWMILYGGVSVISIYGALNRYNRWFILAGLSVCIIWLITLIPDFGDWLSKGMPNITAEMKTEEPHIEATREFFGVLVSGLALLWHWYASGR